MSSDAPRLNPRAISWAATMQGHGSDLVVAHRDSSVRIHSGEPIGREAREEREAATLRPGATLAKAEQSIQTRTQYLTKEVIKYVPTTDAACRSELERVRHVWNAANSGTDPAPATAAERNDALR